MNDNVMPDARELDDYRPWRELALAVVVQAANDYRAAIRAHKRFANERTKIGVKIAEEFFHSPQCDLYLQDMSTGEAIVRNIKKEMRFDDKEEIK